MRRSVMSRCAAVMAAMLMLCAALFVTAAPVDATEETGSITVKVKAEYEGIPYCLVDVGDMNGEEVELYDEFSSLDITSADLKGINSTLAEKLDYAEEYFIDNSITGVIGRIDMQGNVSFNSVPLNKLYILYQPIGKELVDLSPILVPMPTRDPATGEVTKDVVITAKKTEPASIENMGSVILNKTGEDDVRLEGAVFAFYKKVYYTDDTMITEDLETGEDENGSFYWKKFDVDFTTDKNGQISIPGLPFGDYRFVEIEAPEGYMLDDTPQTFTIVEAAGVKVENGLIVPDSGKAVVIDFENLPVIESVDDLSFDESSDSGKIIDGGGVSYDVSYPTPSKVIHDGKVPVEITGDDIAKYVIIGAIVGVSLLVIIIFALVGGRRKSKKEDE